MTILELFYTNTSTLKEYIETLPGGPISTCHLNVQEKQQVDTLFNTVRVAFQQSTTFKQHLPKLSSDSCFSQSEVGINR